MNKQELISIIERENAQLEALIGTLGADQALTPRRIGDWSIKDTLAHLAMWTSRSISVLYQAEQGQAPADIDAMFDAYETLNAADYESQKDRSYDRVVSDLRGTRRQLLRRLSGWSEADLADKALFSWLRGKSMAEYLEDEVDHSAAHRKLIEQAMQ